eukprot:7027488-Pyramimonas_sp.AAC.1
MFAGIHRGVAESTQQGEGVHSAGILLQLRQGTGWRRAPLAGYGEAGLIQEGGELILDASRVPHQLERQTSLGLAPR